MLKKILLLIVTLFVFNSSAFAIVDFGVYGGYSFAGNYSASGTSTSGPEYGVIGHYNDMVIPLLSYGIGGYYQYTKLDYSLLGSDNSLTKNTLGLDLYFQLELPIIHPFVRASTSIFESIKSEKEFFKSYAFGGGLAFSVFPFIELTTDYMYTRSKKGSETLKGHAIHLGARINI